MATKSPKERRKTPDIQAHDFADTQPAEQRAYAEFCFMQGFRAGHRSRVEEAASLQAVEEEALAQIPLADWRELMQTWLDYKRSIHKRYTLVSGIIGCYEDMLHASNGQIEIARQWVQRSINSGYIGVAIPNNGQEHKGSRVEQRREGVRTLSQAASEGASALTDFFLGDEE